MTLVSQGRMARKKHEPPLLDCTTMFLHGEDSTMIIPGAQEALVYQQRPLDINGVDRVSQ